MKNKFTLIISCGILFSTTTCRKALKDPEDYYPEVQTISATVTPEGGVEVLADIVDNGETEIAYAGFCMDTVSVPEMLDNQQMADEISGERFKTTYIRNYDPAKTYYFRSWAANDKGFSYGNVVSITNIRATPISAPCTLNVNSSNIGLHSAPGTGPAGSMYHVTPVSYYSTPWGIYASGIDALAGNLSLTFGSALKTKVFTTTKGFPSGDNVSIEVESGFTSGSVNDGYKVYVNQLDPGKYEITICNAKWTIDNSTYSTELNARFISQP